MTLHRHLKSVRKTTPKLKLYLPIIISTAVVIFISLYLIYKPRIDQEIPTTGAQAEISTTTATIIAGNFLATTTPKTVLGEGKYEYIEVVTGCDHDHSGICVNIRSGPGTEYKIVERLRTGVVLRVATTTVVDGREWYQIKQDSNILYKDRVTTDWYVAADVVQLFRDDGEILLTKKSPPVTKDKSIVIDLSTERLYAYEGDVLVQEELISTGLEFTPTPKGTFRVFKKTPSRYMQGPLPGVSGQEYDLPGVPWDLYFTSDGAVIHGAYWHDQFGKRWSHGCVNLESQNAKRLYMWADIGIKVIVKE